MRFLRLASRAKEYVHRAHSSVGMFVALFSYMSMWFVALEIEWDFVAFALSVGPVLVGVYLLFGWLDIRRGTYPHARELYVEADPAWQDLFWCMKRIGEEEGLKDVVEVSERWLTRRKPRKR